MINIIRYMPKKRISKFENKNDDHIKIKKKFTYFIRITLL